MPRGILGLRHDGRWTGRVSNLISTATSLGHKGRQKIKNRGGEGKGAGSFTPSPQLTEYRLWGKKKIDSGCSRGRGRERSKGCIAKAVALTL